MAKLTQEQQEAVIQWAKEGANLNDIQSRLKTQFSLTLTYLDARLLITDLGIKLQEKKKDAEQPKQEAPAAPPQAAGQDFEEDQDLEVLPADQGLGKGGGGSVKVHVDQIAVPGAMVSGRVTFSDGKSAVWYLDQYSRLGLKGAEPGYQPPPSDIPLFQAELDRALQQAGY